MTKRLIIYVLAFVFLAGCALDLSTWWYVEVAGTGFGAGSRQTLLLRKGKLYIVFERDSTGDRPLHAWGLWVANLADEDDNFRDDGTYYEGLGDSDRRSLANWLFSDHSASLSHKDFAGFRMESLGPDPLRKADPTSHSLFADGEIIGYYTVNAVSGPFWSVLTFIGLFLAWFVYRTANRWWQNRNHREGLCGQCGYDLRASHDRCPECGTPFPKPQPT